MDLLLFLIRAEVDIHDIPIVEITGQYFDFFQGDRRDRHRARRVPIMAATLIGSRAVTKPVTRGGRRPAGGHRRESGADPIPNWSSSCSPTSATARPPSGSTHRLEHSQMHKASVRVTESAEKDEDEGADDQIEIEDAHLGDLIEATSGRGGRRLEDGRSRDRVRRHPDRAAREDLADRLRRAPERRLTLLEALKGKRRIEMIGLFLAVLELAKQHIRVVHEPDVEAISIEPRDEEDREELAGADRGDPGRRTGGIASLILDHSPRSVLARRPMTTRCRCTASPQSP